MKERKKQTRKIKQNNFERFQQHSVPDLSSHSEASIIFETFFHVPFCIFLFYTPPCCQWFHKIAQFWFKNSLRPTYTFLPTLHRPNIIVWKSSLYFGPRSSSLWTQQFIWTQYIESNTTLFNFFARSCNLMTSKYESFQSTHHAQLQNSYFAPAKFEGELYTLQKYVLLWMEHIRALELSCFKNSDNWFSKYFGTENNALYRFLFVLHSFEYWTNNVPM